MNECRFVEMDPAFFVDPDERLYDGCACLRDAEGSFVAFVHPEIAEIVALALERAYARLGEGWGFGELTNADALSILRGEMEWGGRTGW